MSRILLADDHKLLLETLGAYLAQALDGAHIECVSSVAECLRHLRDERHDDYDLAIVDYRMPGSQGVSTIKSFVQNPHGIPIAVMSGLATSAEVIECLEVGAIGYLPKTGTSSSMIHAIRLMLSGERYIPAALFSKSGAVPSARKGGDESEPISDKEMQVLRLLRLGNTNKEIGRALGLEEVTAKLYISRLGKRFGVHNRVQVLIAAMERSLID